MTKYTALLKDLDDRHKVISKSLDELDATIRVIRRLDAEEARNVALGHLSTSTDAIIDKPSSSKSPVLKPGGLEQMRNLIKEIRESKTLRLKAYFMEEVMKDQDASPRVKEKMATRVTNALQTLRRSGAVRSVKIDAANQSTVWGPSEAITDEGKIVEGWAYEKIE